MAKIIVKPKNKEEQNFLTRLLKKMDVKAEVVDESLPNEETQKAIEDVENKKGTKVKNSQDLFNKLGILYFHADFLKTLFSACQ